MLNIAIINKKIHVTMGGKEEKRKERGKESWRELGEGEEEGRQEKERNKNVSVQF
jgi:hypothetical protein